jgi:large subunit ribosomal protein L17
MVTSLLREERIVTTVEKAKDLRPVVEKIITLGRSDSLHARRQAYGYVMCKSVVHKLFTDIGPRYRARPGGYTRIVKGGFRHGDTADMAIIELVSDAS